MNALLEIDALSKAFGTVKAVDDVTLTLPRGASLGLVGESGSGKSTILRCLVGLETPDAGTVRYAGFDAVRADRTERRRFRREVQMVFQNPYASLNPRMTVEEIVAEPLRVHEPKTARAERRDRVVEALERVGLTGSALPRRPARFSGGQRQRIAIARALVSRPEVLVCDEPVSALDVSVQAQVVNLLRGMRRDLGLTILFVAHDLAVVRQLCDHIAVLKDGRVVEEGDREQIYGDPRHPYTRELLAAVPIPDPAADRERRRRIREGR
ncbi:ATP-binding cassette domain-containing protein [Actinocorallia sp. A-T 12471]|uniref:ATP-binding cassette domain-containing protein n=1 Tax=Actinocorallia sp. A-T 12471 TaxID=3089813 RepID=UPI0029CC60FF|nr:ATP-binding cassette domain-containing protein [Actinocorallia sp. A-T 12471]MDX6740803.1 ATP-binding cassette domain-containing protein [Actinocorallia sp. A-T 12471]